MRLALILLVAWCASARADNVAEAKKFHRIGKAAYQRNQFGAAAQNLDRAYELYPRPEIAFSAAQAHRFQYQADRDPAHLRRAIELYEVYVANVKTGSDYVDALTYLERLRDVAGRLEAAGTKIVVVEKQTPSIYVSVAIDGALITVDGKVVDRYVSMDVSPGEHVVTVSADGYLPERRTVTVAKGQAMVPIELRPRPATLSIKTAPGARVLVDGRELTGTSVEPGTRLLTVLARGRRSVTQELALQPGQELTLDVPLVPTLRRRAVRWVAIGTGVLVAGALVTGTVAIISDFSAADLRDSPVPLATRDAARYEKLRDRRDTFRTASFVLGGVALAAAGTALWMYYFDTPSLERPSVTPLVVPGGIGVAYAGAL